MLNVPLLGFVLVSFSQSVHLAGDLPLSNGNEKPQNGRAQGAQWGGNGSVSVKVS